MFIGECLFRTLIQSGAFEMNTLFLSSVFYLLSYTTVSGRYLIQLPALELWCVRDSEKYFAF